MGLTLLLLCSGAINEKSNSAPSEEILIIIGNPDGTPNEIAFGDLVKIMKGYKPRWDNGTKAKLALMKPKTPVGAITAKRIYGMSVNELSKYWVAMVFQGKSSPPEFFNDEEDLIKYVNKTEGAIGIISSAATAKSKIILVDGKDSI